MTNETPPVEVCQCGCGEPLPPQRGYSRKPRRFLPGHNSRVPAIRAAQTTSLQATLERRRSGEPESTHICQCGCGEVIPFKPFHRYRTPLYIREHYLRMGGAVRIEKIRAAKAELRVRPPEDWLPPSGVCECGCGAPTLLAKRSRPKRGEYLGYPRRFIHGHNSRLFTSQQTSRWAGGRVVDRMGYIALHRPGHPSATKYGYVLEHRLVYEESRGVRLPKNTLIHHLNGVKDDNRPENLVAFTRVEHTRAHRLANEVISLFLDDRLLEAAKVYVREHGALPDLEALTAQVYGHD